MSEKTFLEHIQKGYKHQGDEIVLGASIYQDKVHSDALVRLPLKTFNRHGLIAGATGTGKTKTLQILAEHLSHKGIPSLVMDLKGDLSGLGASGTQEDFIKERHQKIGVEYTPNAAPLEFLSLSEEKGIRLRATVSEFGPILLSKILSLTDVQSSIMAVLFKYCDDQKLPLVDLEDLKKVLNHCITDGKEEIQSAYGSMSPVSVNTIIRAIVQLEQQGAAKFFAEPSFEVNDLMQTREGKGVISVLRLIDIQSKPRLFSTFMLSLLSEVYNTFPEKGDLDKPELVLFIDEAHLIFDNASKVFLEQLEAIIKLIRSKGVGIFFITQLPTDIPQEILSQLGMKIQHALRAFTAKDRQSIKLTAENFPLTDFYNTDELLTSLGIGEALVTALDENGVPTPLVATYMRAPMSRMDVLSAQEINEITKQSNLIEKYSKEIDAQSAKEILSKKIDEAQSEEHQKQIKEEHKKASKTVKKKSVFESMSKNTMVRQIGRTVVREITRGLLGALGIRSTSRRKKWF